MGLSRYLHIRFRLRACRKAGRALCRTSQAYCRAVLGCGLASGENYVPAKQDAHTHSDISTGEKIQRTSCFRWIEALSACSDHCRAMGCKIGVTVVLGEVDVARVNGPGCKG